MKEKTSAGVLEGEFGLESLVDTKLNEPDEVDSKKNIKLRKENLEKRLAWVLEW